MYYEIRFYLKHYRASRSRYKSRKVRRISSKNGRYRPFFLFLQPFLIRVGPFINMFRLRYIRNCYFKCSRVCGSGYYGRGGSERHLAVRILEILSRKNKLITFLYLPQGA